MSDFEGPGSLHLRILLADDAWATINSIRLMLRLLPDVEVVATARNGRQAIEMTVEYKPDIALVDINMPEVNGLLAMQAMRERAKQRASAEGLDQAPWNMETAEEHRTQMEKMRNATPGERAALRDEHWAEMRERAAAQGITMPETPPWKEAEQRCEARKAQWESYRKIIDQMTEEQRQAAEAIFGQPPMPPMGRDMNPPMPYGQDFGAPPARPYPPANPAVIMPAMILRWKNA